MCSVPHEVETAISSFFAKLSQQNYSRYPAKGSQTKRNPSNLQDVDLLEENTHKKILLLKIIFVHCLVEYSTNSRQPLIVVWYFCYK